VLAGALCALAVGLKWRFGFDDSLDVVGVHLVGGAFGSIALGFLSLEGGLFYEGRDIALLGKQTVAVLAVGTFSFVGAFVIGKAIDMTIGFRLDEDSEVEGIDLNEHAESGYDLTAATRGHRGLPGTPPAGAPEPQDARHDAGDKGSVNA
jgi:Amt family ammonium transporter